MTTIFENALPPSTTLADADYFRVVKADGSSVDILVSDAKATGLTPATGVITQAMVTAAGGASDALYYAKLKTWTVPTASLSYSNQRILLVNTISNTPIAADCDISVSFLCDATGTLDSANAKINVNSINGSEFAYNKFFLVQTVAGTVELWMQKQLAYCQFSVTEIAYNNTNVTSIAWNSGAAWQVTDPTSGAAVAITSGYLSVSPISRNVMTTALATAGYYSDLATINLGTLDNSEVILRLLLTSGQGSSLCTADILVIAKQVTSAAGISLTESKIQVLSISDNTNIKYNDFFLAASAVTAGTAIHFWMKSETAVIWKVQELAAQINSNAATPVSYNDASTWTVTDPLAGPPAVALTSYWNNYSADGAFDGTLASPTIPGTRGVLSAVTKVGTGQYRITFDKTWPDAAYTVLCSLSGGLGFIQWTTRTTTTFDINTYNSTGASTDFMVSFSAGYGIH